MEMVFEHPEAFQTDVTNNDEKLCRDFFDDVWARGNADRLGDYLDDHFHWNAAPGYDDDRDGYAHMVRDLHAAFPDLHADVEEVIAANGNVAAHWTMEGTHKGVWMGVPGTGKKLRMEGLALDTVRNGRITRELAVQDTADMLLKLGVVDLGTLTTA